MFCNADPPPIAPGSTGGGPTQPGASQNQPNAGDLQKLSKNKANKAAQQHGFENAEAFKRNEVRKRAGNYNMSVDKSTGEIILTPVNKGGGPNVPTGMFRK